MRRRPPEPRITALPQLPAGLPAGRQEWLTEAQCFQPPFPAVAPIHAEAQTLAAALFDTHIHYAMEVGVLLSGEQERFTEEFAFRALPGDVWLIPMWEPHGWQTVREKTRIVLIHFLPELLGGESVGDVSWLAAFAVPPPRRPSVSTPEVRAQVTAIAAEMWTEIQTQQYAWVTTVRADLLRLLALLHRHWERTEDDALAHRVHMDNLARVMPAITALQQHSERRITVSEAADLCRLSRRQFYRVFSRTMGVGFERFALRARLGHVERLLTATDLPIETVARESGFVDLPHLHRHFVKHYGCAPGAFRKRVPAK